MSDKKVDLSNIKLLKNGNYDWGNSVGETINFKYDDIEGCIKIIEYNGTNKITIKYKDKTHIMSSDKIKKGGFGNILNKRTTNFKIEIGQIFKDKNRDYTIIDREKRESPYRKNTILKYYKYHCNKCGAELWKIEQEILTKKQGCSCCNGRTVVEGINDIPTTAPWMIKYFQGGYDEAKKYTYNCREKIIPICPYCSKIKDKAIYVYSIYNNKSIGCNCNLNWTSFPERFIMNVLNQLINNCQLDKYIYQYDKSIEKWIGKYKYDLYFKLNNEKYIIEINGEQHYINPFKYRCSLQQEQQNDLNKYNLAIQNGIKPENYIVIDCRKSELEFIKNNILSSRLNEIFDLSSIDWDNVLYNSISNEIKRICLLKKTNDNLTVKEISDMTKHNNETIRRWLHIGDKIGICNYKGYSK